MKPITPEFLNVQWQTGTVPEAGINGVQVEDVLALALARLHFFQGTMPCEENANAIRYTELALSELHARTHRRVAQGVEGQHVAHVSAD